MKLLHAGDSQPSLKTQQPGDPNRDTMINFKHLNSGGAQSTFAPKDDNGLLDNNAFHLPNEEELDHSARQLLLVVKSLIGQSLSVLTSDLDKKMSDQAYQFQMSLNKKVTDLTS